MSGEAWLYLFAVLINAVNLFLQVFFTIMYSDLEWYVASASSVRALPWTYITDMLDVCTVANDGISHV